MTDDRLRTFLLRAGSAAAAAGICYLAVRWLLPWLLPFLLAAAGAAALEPPVRLLQQKLRLRRGFASLVMTLVLIFLLGGLLSLLAATLAAEARTLLAQAPMLLERIPAVFDSLARRVRQYGVLCPPWLREQADAALAQAALDTESLLSRATAAAMGAASSAAGALPRVLLGTATTLLAVYFTSASWPALRQLCANRLSERSRSRLTTLRKGLASSLARWLRAELTLSLITFAELFCVLAFLREPYALLLSVLITLVDALPVFGVGTILIPWAAIELLLENLPKAVILLALYLLTLAVHWILEPRLLGAQAGVPAIFSLLAIYLGFCVLGVGGMILFPFLLLLAAQLFSVSRAETL